MQTSGIISKVVQTVKTSTSSGLGSAKLIGLRHGPVVLTSVAGVGVVVGAVMACVATRKIEPVLEKHRDELSDVSDGPERSKELAKVYGHTAGRLSVLYGPSVAVGLVSLSCMVGAQLIMRRQNAALAAAYTVVERGFAEYRNKVIQDVGEEKDKEYRFQSLVDVGDLSVEDFQGRIPSVHAKFFDEASPYWEKIPEYNLIFLNTQQRYANDILNAKGHIFLNEVYDLLGIERTQAGQVLGWKLGPNSQNFVNFGIYDFGGEYTSEFVNGQERSILLDFNVDARPIIYSI